MGSLIPIRPGIPLQTRMQVFATSPGAMYTGLGNAFTRISSTEGVRVLWRGVSSVIMGAGPAHAVHFGTYEAIKEVTGGNREGNANWLSARESPPPTAVLLEADERRRGGCASPRWCFGDNRQRRAHEPLRR